MSPPEERQKAECVLWDCDDEFTSGFGRMEHRFVLEGKELRKHSTRGERLRNQVL